MGCQTESTKFLENDGTTEAAQRIAGLADSRTTKLYDRRGQKVLLEDMGKDSVLAAIERSNLANFVHNFLTRRLILLR
jgi:hypothetical protein